MDKEKKTLQTCFSACKYLAPSVEVVKIKATSVICSSIMNLEFGSEQDDNDFE